MKKEPAPLPSLFILSLHKARQLLSDLGWGMRTGTLERAIYEGRLKAYADPFRTSCTGKPRVLIYRSDLDDFIRNALEPINQASGHPDMGPVVHKRGRPSKIGPPKNINRFGGVPPEEGTR